MATVDDIKANILTRLLVASGEIAASTDGDSNEYLMRRYEEFERATEMLKRLDTLEGDTDIPGSYEIITHGET